MLGSAHRLRRGPEFSAVVRAGARSGNRRLVVHYSAGQSSDSSPALVGVVVAKRQVPLATHRNRVKRRLRALAAAQLDTLRPGDRVVIRALAAADGVSSAELGRDVDTLLRRCRRHQAQGRRR